MTHFVSGVWTQGAQLACHVSEDILGEVKNMTTVIQQLENLSPLLKWATWSDNKLNHLTRVERQVCQCAKTKDSKRQRILCN